MCDDIVLMAESPEALQSMLDVVFKYSQQYRFKFNQDKSNVMIFGMRDTSKVRKFYLGEVELKIVDKYKYLGLVVDQNFTWKQHVENLSRKAKQKMRGIFGLGVGKGLSVRALLRGWEVLVRPLLEFSCEIWGEKPWKQLENLQGEMGRRVLGVTRTTTKEVIQGELGLISISSRRILLRLRFWEKLIRMKEKHKVDWSGRYISRGELNL